MTTEVVIETGDSAGYMWFIFRSLVAKEERGEIKLHRVAGYSPPGSDSSDYRFVRTMWIDDDPIILDVRDYRDQPTAYMQEYPTAPVLKSSMSTDLDGNNWKLNPFVFGRSGSAPLGAKVRGLEPNEYHPGGPQVATVMGTGNTPESTAARLRMLELLQDIDPASLLEFWPKDPMYARQPSLDRRGRAFADTRKSGDLHRLGIYYRWLKQARFGINVPGIRYSPPFRCVDDIIVGHPTISTRIYADAYSDFPCYHLPVCGYTGDGDWDGARAELGRIYALPQADLNDMVARANGWYERHLSVDGMWQQLRGVLG